MARGPGYGGLPLAVSRPQKDPTCTSLTDCHTDRAAHLRLREQRLEEEERRRVRLSSGGSGGAALSRLPAGMLNLGNTCYLNAVLQVLLL